MDSNYLTVSSAESSRSIDFLFISKSYEISKINSRIYKKNTDMHIAYQGSMVPCTISDCETTSLFRRKKVELGLWMRKSVKLEDPFVTIFLNEPKDFWE